MALQFECPACGGIIDYPAIDKILDDYDLTDHDPYYYEDAFEEELKVTCDWCKQRVEVPLDIPAATPPLDPLKCFDDKELAGAKTGSSTHWLGTITGKIVIGIILLIYIVAHWPFPF
jgi:hypothetical protein